MRVPVYEVITLWYRARRSVDAAILLPQLLTPVLVTRRVSVSQDPTSATRTGVWTPLLLCAGVEGRADGVQSPVRRGVGQSIDDVGQVDEAFDGDVDMARIAKGKSSIIMSIALWCEMERRRVLGRSAKMSFTQLIADGPYEPSQAVLGWSAPRQRDGYVDRYKQEVLGFAEKKDVGNQKLQLLR